MMTSHKQTIEYLNEKIAAVEVEVRTAQSMIEPARLNYERKRRDAEALEHELAALRDTLRVLVEDAADVIAEAPC